LINHANANFIHPSLAHEQVRSSLSAHRLKTTHAVLHLALLQLQLALAEGKLALAELHAGRAGGVVAAGAGDAARGGVVGVLGEAAGDAA
jgi:hypothetical protein